MSEFISITGHHQDHRMLKLAGDINVFLAAELHRSCIQVSRGASSVVIDCNEVTSLDVAALQIFVALKDALSAQGGTLGITRLSAEVADTVHLSGLERRLGFGDGSMMKGGTE